MARITTATISIHSQEVLAAHCNSTLAYPVAVQVTFDPDSPDSLLSKSTRARRIDSLCVSVFVCVLTIYLFSFLSRETNVVLYIYIYSDIESLDQYRTSSSGMLRYSIFIPLVNSIFVVQTFIHD